MQHVFWALLLPLAQEEEAAQNPLPFFAMLGIIFAIVYFLVFKPQQNEEKKRTKMVEGLKKNDKVVTNGGIVGIVMNVKGDEVILRVDDAKGVKMHFIKSAIAGTLEEMKQDTAGSSTGTGTDTPSESEKDSK